jgi:hypothetical protein
MTTTNETKLQKADGLANLMSDNSKFKKGSTAFEVRHWETDDQTEKVTVQIRKIQIESFGKKQGTATAEESGTFIGVNLSPKFSILAHSLDDAKKMAAQLGLHESAMSIAGSLRCAKSWLDNYSCRAKPAVVAKAKAKIAFLETAKPSFNITEKN